MKPSVVLVGHGSREKGFQSAMKKVAARLKKDKRFAGVLCAYLEIASPSIEEAIARLAAKGGAHIRILPYFVLSGRHVKSHIPAIVSRARKKYGRGVKITLCPYLGYDESLVLLAQKRILETA